MCVHVSVAGYALKAIISPQDKTGHKPSEKEIEQQFKSDYILPCQPHPNILKVLHHFCQEVQPGGTICCRLILIGDTLKQISWKSVALQTV